MPSLCTRPDPLHVLSQLESTGLKEQALFFDDLGTVYPPPKDDQDSKAVVVQACGANLDFSCQVDLLAVMHKLAVHFGQKKDRHVATRYGAVCRQVRKHAVEVEQAKHPVQLGNSCNCSDLGV